MANPVKNLSGRAKFNIVLATMALSALVVVSSSLTHQTPQFEIEDEAGDGIATDHYLLEDGDRETSGLIIGRNGREGDSNIMVQPLEQNAVTEGPTGSWEETPALYQEGPLDSLGDALTKLTVEQNTMVKDRKQQKVTPPKVKPASKKTQAAAGGAAGGTSDSPAVQKALKDAANAKVQAMSAQQKALIAGTEAKKAAAAAAQAPMTQAGQEVVRRSQQKIATAKLDVDTAKAALSTLARLKAKASKVIIDAAGGKYAKETGYVGQGGYFGTALRTAFKNGELTERMKHAQWKTKTLVELKKKAFKQGEAKGVKKGEKKGVKIGEKHELPIAVARAEKLLTKKKKEKNLAKAAGKKAAQDAALKAAAETEAAKVRESVKAEAKAKQGENPKKSVTKLEAEFENDA